MPGHAQIAFHRDETVLFIECNAGETTLGVQRHIVDSLRLLLQLLPEECQHPASDALALCIGMHAEFIDPELLLVLVGHEASAQHGDALVSVHADMPAGHPGGHDLVDAFIGLLVRPDLVPRGFPEGCDQFVRTGGEVAFLHGSEYKGHGNTSGSGDKLIMRECGGVVKRRQYTIRTTLCCQNTKGEFIKNS